MRLAQVKELESEKEQLHKKLEKKGVNSRGVCDVFGRPFDLPVDENHKAVYLKIPSFANPHMRAFHCAWYGFFATSPRKCRLNDFIAAGITY